MKNINYSICNNAKFRSFIYAVLSVLTEFLIICVFSDINYMTSDDPHIQLALSGAYTGNVYPFHQFINVFLGYFICTLYSLFPHVQWWFIYSLFCMSAGLIMLHYTIFYNFQNAKIALTIIVCLAVGFELYCISQLSFLIVPVYFSLGAISLLLINKTNTCTRWNSCLVTFTSVVLIISYLQREEAILLMFAFYALVLAIYTLKVHNKLSLQAFGKFIITISSTLLIMLSLSNTSSNIKADVNGDSFQQYNTNRINFMDYPKPSYEEAFEIYEKYSWDETSFKLINSWCLMIEEYNSEALTGINSELGLNGLSISAILENGISQNFNKIYDYFMNIGVNYTGLLKLSLFFALILYVLYGIYAFIIKKTSLDPNYIYGLLSLCGGTFILIALIIYGRTPERVLISVTFPAITIATIMFFQQNNIIIKCPTKLLILFYGIVFLGFLIILHILPRYDDNYKALTTYCNSHKEDIFITATHNNMMISLNNEFPPNLLFWGDSTSYSDLYYKRLQRLGLEELDLATLNNENVYFISTKHDSQYPQMLLTEVRKYYSNANNELILQINNELYIYQFNW